MKLDILCCGSLTLDRFIKPSALPLGVVDGVECIVLPVGAKVNVEDSSTFVGGGGANTAIGFQKLNLRAGVLGVVGDDDRGEFISHQLHRYDIDTCHLQTVVGGQSSASTVIMTPDGRRTVFAHKLTSDKLGQANIRNQCPPKAVYLAHIPQEHEGLLTSIIDWQKATNGYLFWNPGSTQFKQGVGAYTHLFPCVHTLILNVEEAEAFCGLKAKRTENGADVRPHAEAFLTAGATAVVVTDGRNGAHYFHKNGEVHTVAALGGVPISTLGAGDAYSVGYASALLHGHNATTAMAWGAENSASTIQLFGAQNGQLTYNQMVQKQVA